MNSPSDGVEPSAKGSGLFTTPHWSVVLAEVDEEIRYLRTVLSSR